MHMKRSIILSIVVCGLVATSCCKKCDLPFEGTELTHLKYDFTGTRTFRNTGGAEISVGYVGLDVQDSGKTCGGFGQPDPDFCASNAAQKFDVSGGIANFSVELNKFRDETSIPELRMLISMGDANIYVFFDGNAIDPSVDNRTSTVTINGTDYDDVLTYFFDPNTDCKQPSSANCVDGNDIVGLDFSLSAGLLRFQVHKGLQTPNDVYTLFN